MSKQIESKGIEELAKNIDNPDDAAKLIKKLYNMIKSKKIDFVKFIDMYPKMQNLAFLFII